MNKPYEKRFPIALKEELDKEFVGQNVYKETMAVSIYRHIYKKNTTPMLVMGPTGCGKTFLFQLLKKSRLIPENYTIMTTNVSRLTEAGVKGPDLDDIFIQYGKMCMEEHNTECRGIIYIDELDKLISPNIISSGNGDFNRNAAIQHQLMQILDGEEIEGVPTGNILFVFGGAFHQLDKIRDKEENHRTIGFGAEQPIDSCHMRDSIREKLIEVGFQREFLGRIGQIVQMGPLSELELKTILLHPTRGVISKMQREFATDGIKLEVSREATEDIIKEIVRENLGARSVRNIIEKIVTGALYQCMDKDYNTILIDREVLESGNVKYFKKKGQVEIQGNI